MPVVVGLTAVEREGTFSLRANYSEAIFGAGGIPVPLPYSADPERLAAYSVLDGLLLTGGGDVDPAFYGETVCDPSVTVDRARDKFELAVCRAFLAVNKPVFGICRGIQLLNVALGGTLVQHIGNHRQTEPGAYASHSVTVLPGTRLATLIGPGEHRVNSFHHQATAQPAPGLVVSARAPDGTIEALEASDGRFLIGVQWHPEYDPGGSTDGRALFAGFIRAALARKRSDFSS